MVTLSYIAIVLYIGFVIWLILGLSKAKKNRPAAASVLNRFSLVIPFKNEASNLPELFRSILHTDYPHDYFEVVFVDDHSSDNSLAMVEEFCASQSNARVIITGSAGKKGALLTAMGEATNPLIVCCDADTQWHRERLKALNDVYEAQKPAMIIGRVQMRAQLKGMFNLMQAMEYKSVEAVTFGSAGHCRPQLCSGANLLFDKRLIDDAEKVFRTDIASGDDMFLLDYFKKRGEKIDFAHSKGATVYIQTEPAHRFFNQRARWTSKFPGYASWDILYTGALVFSVNLLLVFWFLFGLFSGKYITFFELFILKFISDAFLLIMATRNNEFHLFRVYPLLAFLFPFYVVWVVAKGVLGKRVWK
jgi:poly-beta-1,6-N-acetyl-D-glucosamine synthase